jgi:hypothetical protein
MVRGESRWKLRVFVVVVLSAVALVPAARGTVRTQDGPLTTIPNVFVDIQVTLTDTRITLNRHTVNRGIEGRFIIRNVGTKRHSFTLGGTSRGTVQPGFSRTVNPREQYIELVFLNYRGPVPYRSVIPADRSKPGMKGIFRIL